MSVKNLHPFIVSIKKEVSDLKISNVCVALSGGADSIAATFALREVGLNIIALHCNFHLRGEESNRDMEFVSNFAKVHEIPLEIKEFNVKNYLKDHKSTSLEMACRDLRHNWFKDKMMELGFDRIVIGHNADDNIETFFLNLLRGSGSRGLKGMNKDNGKIWRPLLQFHREEILEYLKINNLSYVTDSTNLTNDYRRNYLRNVIFPLFKKEWKGFNVTLDRTLQNLNTENLLVEDLLDQILPLPLEPLAVSKILSSKAPLLVIKRFIEPLGPFSSTPNEVLSAIKANKPHIRKWVLKKGILYLRNGNLFIEMSHGEWCS